MATNIKIKIYSIRSLILLFILVFFIQLTIYYPNVSYAKSVDNANISNDTKIIDYKIYEHKDIFSLNGDGSMMFSKDDLIKLYNLLKKAKSRNIYEKYPDLKKIKEGEGDPSKEKRIIPNSQNFSLDSILYYNNDNWSIWINNTKTTSSAIQDNPKITYVSKNNVIVVWQNLDFNKTSPNWKESFLHIKGTPTASQIITSDDKQSEEEIEEIRRQKKAIFDEGKYILNYVSKDNKVKLDSENNVIEFNIMLHQTFVGYKLYLAEGIIKQNQNVNINMINNKENISDINRNSINNVKKDNHTTDTNTSEGNNTEFDSLVNDIFNDPNL